MHFRPKRIFQSAILFFVFLLVSSGISATEINFDFGLPLFNFEEIRFEKSKTVDFNIQLLKKYLDEHEGYPITQFHCITRWFALLKLSDNPRRDQLIAESSKIFSLKNIKAPGIEERLRAIYFSGLLLAQDREDDPKNLKDHDFEDLLIESEDHLARNGNYHLIKGILFHFLRNRPNDYFKPMKPEEDLKRALALVPSSAHYFYVMGQAFRLLGTNDSSLFLSIASYEKASSLEPRNPKLQNSLLSIYMGLHEDFQSRGTPEPFWLEEAVYKKIISMSPNNPHALNNLGYLYAEYGVNTQMAQELCQRAVDMQPQNPGFHDSLGWAAFKNRDYETAEAHLLKSIELKNNVYDPHYHLGTVYYATGKLDKAAEYYEKAIGIKPDSAETLNNLAYLFTEQNKNLNEALKMSEQAVRLEPNNASYVDTLGWAYYRLGKLEKALETLKKAAQLAPGQGEILLHIGRVYLDMHDFANAMAYLKEAHKADPNLNDPDNSVYMAIRLRHYLASLEEYHSLKGERADKDKIINILMAISRLYQEERMYDRAIEITRLCSEIKRGERSLAQPILGDYDLPGSKEKKETGAQTPEQTNPQNEADTTVERSAEELEAGPAEPQPQSKDEETKAVEDGLFSGMPPETDHPLIIQLGPGFFDLIKPLVPGAEIFTDKAVTIFMRKVNIKVYRNSVFRIESESSSGSSMLQTFATSMQQMGFPLIGEITHEQGTFRIGKRKMYLRAFENSLLISSKPIDKESSPEKLAMICRYNPSSFAEIVYNWKSLQKLLPPFLKIFIHNPCAPYQRIYSRYFLRDGSLNEFSALTTGKTEDSVFMRNMARELFAFKLYMQKFGIDTTIKLRSDQEVIYLSTDFMNIPAFFDKQLGNLKGILVKLLKQRSAKMRCFFNRTWFNPANDNICPTGGKMSLEANAGIIECSHHEDVPTIPVFLDEHHSCKFSRMRIEKIIKENNLSIPESSSELSEFFTEIFLKYEIPPCPTDGSWQIDNDGSIKCSDHEN